MTIVLVHGAPETAAVWNPLLDELAVLGHRDIVRLSPPGFGAPMTDDFGATISVTATGSSANSLDSASP